MHHRGLRSFTSFRMTTGQMSFPRKRESRPLAQATRGNNKEKSMRARRMIAIFILLVFIGLTGCAIKFSKADGSSIEIAAPVVVAAPVITTPVVVESEGCSTNYYSPRYCPPPRVVVPAPVVVEPYVPYYYTPPGCCYHFWQGHHHHGGGHHRR